MTDRAEGHVAPRIPLRLLTSILLLATLFGLHPAAAEAQADAQGEAIPPAERFSITRATSEIEVDGSLDEAAWASAEAMPLPYEWMPGDNVPAVVETEVLVTFDQENLYVGFRASDPRPQEIRANLADRDTPFMDDVVGFLVDPFNDERRGFQFRINPLGVQMDAIFSENEGYEDFSWDAIWASAGSITDDGFVVEVAVPFKSLRFPRTEGPQTWGFQAFRDYPRGLRHRFRSHPSDRNRACLLCQMNKVEGIQGVSPGRNVELAPTLSAGRTDNLNDFPSGSLEKGKTDYEPGVTARWSITPNMVFNGTVNPDFSQVEADVAQLDVNTRFALFFPERRPFFLEGADFFLTPINVIFTRTVADPQAGAKLTGKEGPHAVGVFLTRDRINNLIFPANQGSQSASLDDEVTGAVVRYRRDVGAGSTLGALFTGREGTGYHNRVYGADAFLRLSRTNTLEAQYLRSSTEYPQEVAATYGQQSGSFAGDAFTVTANHRSREWFVLASMAQQGEDFRADAGFIPRADFRQYTAFLNRTFWGEPGDWYSSLRTRFIYGRIEDLSGRLTDQEFAFGGTYAGPMQSQLSAGISFLEQFFAGETYDLTTGGIDFEIRPSGVATLNFGIDLGETVDFSNARKAKHFALRPQAELKLGRHVNLTLQHVYQRLYTDEARTFLANLSQARILYHLNVRAYFRAIFQYRTVERNVDQYGFAVDPETESLFTQFLFSYKVNPQTVLFLGYSDNRLGMLEPELVRVDLTRTDRTFFFKIGYAWRP
jgi:hypothetical protein